MPAHAFVRSASATASLCSSAHSLTVRGLGYRRRYGMRIACEAVLSHPEVDKDSEKEAARRSRRTMFNLADWRRHRSNSRHLHHITTIMESGVVKAIVAPVLCATMLSAVLAFYNWCIATQPPWLPAWLPPPPAIAIEPIQLTSFALSLLLVFRTNASYARWEEARRKFGTITTTARDIARQAFSWLPMSAVDAKATLARWLVALARCCMVHVRDEHHFETELRHILTPQELQWLARSSHRPNFCLQVLSKLLANARLPNELLIRLDENMSKLVSAVSSCERVINTPIPLSYTRHTARFLMVWLACLPFTLWSYCGWAMVPLTALISFVLLGIEEIGVYIEEPFSVMALERLCERLEVNMQAMLREHQEIDQYLSQAAVVDKSTVSAVRPDASPRAVNNALEDTLDSSAGGVSSAAASQHTLAASGRRGAETTLVSGNMA
ncbi:hypothetical protein QJQ45_017130 [Haematococcus lacustris]|nr:hypothetical protein QJQ45_017130 [Haematococcus lacustris]